MADDLRQRVHKALTSQKQKTVTVLSSLLAVEDELGYIPQEAVEEVARLTHATINDVWGVASFYTNFQFAAPGQHKVEVCWGPPCHILGAMAVTREVLETLGLSGEGTTTDGRVSMRFNTCLGACAQGPVISVDHQLFGRLIPARARELIAQLKQSGDDGHQHAS